MALRGAPRSDDSARPSPSFLPELSAFLFRSRFRLWEPGVGGIGPGRSGDIEVDPALSSGKGAQDQRRRDDPAVAAAGVLDVGDLRSESGGS